MVVSIARRATRVVCLALVLAGASVTPLFAQTPPSPWLAQDIGSPVVAGGSSFNQGTFTVNAAGNDIWNASDQFHFVYQQVSGDVEIIARVDSLTMTDPWSKTGVMIRSSLAANAAHGSSFVSAGEGTAFQRRTQVGGASESTTGPVGAAPRWVRIARAGTTVTAYSSTDGSTWTRIDRITIALGATAYVGLATTSQVPGAWTTAEISQVSVIPLSLPSGQTATDIGAPAIPGSVSYRLGAYTQTAAGTDIWSTADQFHFVYQQVTGDVEIKARVNSIDAVDNWSKTGVMIRESLTAGSRNAFALTSVAKGYAFQRRVDTGGFSVRTISAGTAPGWVRLVRTGDRLEGFRSADGTTWTSMGWDAIPMAQAVYVGIATTSRNAATATQAVLDSLTITPIGTVPNQPPAAALTSPVSGATFTVPASITMNATASDSDGTIARVEFFAGSTLVGTGTTAPYAATWSAVPAGTYSLTAKAYDDAGSSTTSAAVTVQVNAAVNQPPTATLTAPAGGATYTAPASVSLTATAMDSDGTIARVEFYSGTTLLNTDSSAPYAFTWSSVAAGTYGIRVVAYDNAGASGASATATITVGAPQTSVGLVGAYGFDEGTGTSVGDVSGSGRPGTLAGATWVAGRYGQALSFDGNDSVTVGDVDMAGAFTVSGWLQTRSLYSGGCGSFLMKAGDYGMEMCNGQLYANVGANGNWTAIAAVPFTSADLNVWKHLAMTYDGTKLRVYLNGVLMNTATGAHASNDNPLVFGRWTPASEYWNGLIDDVRLYSRSQTQSEIQTDMNTQLGGGPVVPVLTTAIFQASPDHATWVTSYRLDVFAAGADPNMATPIASWDLGKPAPAANNDITVNLAAFFSGLAPGSYIATMSAIGSAGGGRGMPPTAFTR